MSTHSCEWLNCDLANNVHAPDDFKPLPYVRDGGHREQVIDEARRALAELPTGVHLLGGSAVAWYQRGIVDLTMRLVFANPGDREGIKLLLGIE